MIVFNRKVGEKIRLGEDVTVTVKRITNENVYLAIDAPLDKTVWRKEIWDRIEEKRDHRLID